MAKGNSRHTLTTINDGTYLTGHVGLSTYQTSAMFDNVVVTPALTGQIVQHTFAAGTYPVTLTVTDTVGNGGFLKLYSAALVTPPSTSSINWFGPGQNLAITTQVAVDSAGRVKVTDGANPTNFVIDVIGYLF